MKCLFCGRVWHPETGRTFGWPTVFHSCPECFEKEVVPLYLGSFKRKERLCARRFGSQPKGYFFEYAVPTQETP